MSHDRDHYKKPATSFQEVSKRKGEKCDLAGKSKLYASAKCKNGEREKVEEQIEPSGFVTVLNAGQCEDFLAKELSGPVRYSKAHEARHCPLHQGEA